MNVVKNKIPPDSIFILFLLILVAIFFGRVLVSPHQIIYGTCSDTISFFYPMYSFAKDMLSGGHLPLWNPYIFSGEPFAANPQMALFYPLNILFVILPTHSAFGYSYLLHIFLGGVFMYLFTRYIGLDKVSSFISAIIFMFSGFLVSHLWVGHYSMICAAIWIPLIFLLFEVALNKRSLFYGLVAGIPLGFQLMAGHLQMAYFTLIALGLYLLFRCFLIGRERNYKDMGKLVAIFGLVLAIGILLAAIELFPDYEFSTYSTRAGGMSYDWATFWSNPPIYLSLLLFNPLANPIVDWSLAARTVWGAPSDLFVGILPLIFALFGIAFRRDNKYVIFFSLLAFLSLLLSLGSHFPPYWLLYKAIPGFDVFNSPGRFVFLSTFSFSILAGFGFNFLRGKISEQQKKSVWKILKILAIVVFLTMIVAGALKGPIISYVQEHFPPSPPLYRAIFIDLFTLLVLFTIGTVILALRIKNKISLNYFNVIAVLLILATLWFYHIRFIDTRNVQEVYNEPGYVNYLRDNSEDYRVYDPAVIMPGNYNMVHNIREIYGYDATMLKHYSEFLHGYSRPVPYDFATEDLIPNLWIKLSLLNVKYVLTSEPLNDSDLELVFNENNVYIYEYQQPLPKAFIVHKAVVMTSKGDIINELNDQNFDPKEYIILERSAENVILANEGDFDEAKIIRYSPNEIIIEADTEHPGFLVLSEVYYPSWKAYVDGKPSEIYKTDYALMSVYMADGNHTVRFVYDPVTLKVGAGVTCSTAILLAGIAAAYIMRQRRSKRP